MNAGHRQAHQQALSYDLDYDADQVRSRSSMRGQPRRSASCAAGACSRPATSSILLRAFLRQLTAPAVSMAGASARPVTLSPPRSGASRYDRCGPRGRLINARRRAPSSSTRPHNPTGKVFSRAELEHIAELCVAPRPHRHHRRGLRASRIRRASTSALASLPGMRQRTVVISSSGQDVQRSHGWKIGWACAPPDLTVAHEVGAPVHHLLQRHAAAARHRQGPERCPTTTFRTT